MFIDIIFIQQTAVKQLKYILNSSFEIFLKLK